MIQVINDLYHKAMQTGDMKTGGKHVLELSSYDQVILMQSSRAQQDITISGHRQYFRGLFKIKIIYEPLVCSSVITSDKSINETKSHWHHVSTHVERANGRMVYYDWDGNDRSVL
jgi:hypothetical protein